LDTLVYCADTKLTKRLADAMKPYFLANRKMHLSLSRSRVLTPEFVETLFDLLYKRHGVKVSRLVKLICHSNEDMQYLQAQGYNASKVKYEAKKEAVKHGD
jgi:hypothetical protein